MSTPTLTKFDPRIIPWQYDVINYIHNYDFSNGLLELMFSGTVGSAKTVETCHLIAVHAITNPNSKVLILRRALKDLKRTIWDILLKHLADSPNLIKQYNKSEMSLELVNGSKILGDSFDSGDYEKFKSLDLSMCVIEEATESDKDLYDILKTRLGRIQGIKQNIFIMLTNPDGPDHYLYKNIILKETQSRKVFYSKTADNPFIPKWYIDSLREDLDPITARRLLNGEWVSNQTAMPYYAYKSEISFKKDVKYKINPNLPIDLMHDFNIGEGKPMSAAIGQTNGTTFHVIKEFIVDGFNTGQIMDEIADSGIFENYCLFRIFGDSSGRNKDTRNNKTDYEIIKKFLSDYRRKDGSSLVYEDKVPRANPEIRKRQEAVNSRCCNDKGEVNLFIYQDAPTVDEGLRLTKIKKGSSYQEDDKDRYQHVVTALGYWITKVRAMMKESKGVIIQGY